MAAYRTMLPVFGGISGRYSAIVKHELRTERSLAMRIPPIKSWIAYSYAKLFGFRGCNVGGNACMVVPMLSVSWPAPVDVNAIATNRGSIGICVGHQRIHPPPPPCA